MYGSMYRYVEPNRSNLYHNMLAPCIYLSFDPALCTTISSSEPKVIIIKRSASQSGKRHRHLTFVPIPITTMVV